MHIHTVGLLGVQPVLLASFAPAVTTLASVFEKLIDAGHWVFDTEWR
jgi:hypothetical protein